MHPPENLTLCIAQNFAYRLIERLSGFPVVEESGQGGATVILGKLALARGQVQTKKMADCKFEIPGEWWLKIPVVHCYESWIRAEKDWHISAKGKLCFELDERWKREMPDIVGRFGYGPAAEYGVAWLINSSRSLLYRHLLAYRENIREWPKEWDAWEHEQFGEVEYSRRSLEKSLKVMKR